ncbi:hypothetical protein J6590_105250 [Homalodisca vitripennis]|nr:hypothetical protein J6590_105250 [Homalodisca vitripennis]
MFLNFRQKCEVASKPALIARGISDMYFPDIRSRPRSSNFDVKSRIQIQAQIT